MIIYTLISKSDGTVLTEATTSGIDGNFPQVTRILLDRLKITTLTDPILAEGSSRTFVHRNKDVDCWDAAMDMFPTAAMCFPQDSHDMEAGSGLALDNYFHVSKSGGVIYLCIADDIGSRHAVNFSFLEKVKSEFTSKNTRSKITKANAYAMDKSFSPTLQSFMHYHNTNQTATMGSPKSISALSAQIDDLKHVIGSNISLVLKRGDNLELLVQKSEDLLEDATVFSKNGRKLKRAQKKDRNRLNAYIALAVFIVIYIVSASVCGPFFGRCGHNEDG